MNIKIFLYACACYFIWGSQSLYWNLFDNYSSSFILALRIVTSFLVTLAFLAATGKAAEVKAMICNKSVMRFVLPATALLAVDWGFFIWAVGQGYVTECSLGYYLNPLMLFLMGMFFFKEKANNLEKASAVAVVVGVILFLIISGTLPLVSLVTATVFPAYALCKKFAAVDPIVSICVETMIMTPFALLYALIFLRGNGGFAEMTFSYIPLYLGCGIITAFPLIVYNLTVNRLPMKMAGMLQYMGSTIGVIVGVVFFQEPVTTAKAVLFAFILTGVVLFTLGNFKKKTVEQQAA